MYARVLNTYKGKAEIELLRCEDSEENIHCGACSMVTQSSEKPKKVLAENRKNANPGDIVKYGIKEHAELKAAFVLLLLPLMLFIVSLGISSFLAFELWHSFFLGVAVLTCTYLILRFILKNKTYYYITGKKQ